MFLSFKIVFGFLLDINIFVKFLLWKLSVIKQTDTCYIVFAEPFEIRLYTSWHSIHKYFGVILLRIGTFST